MIDIVERLRAEATDNRRYEVSGTLATEAADRIEQLEAELEQCQNTLYRQIDLTIQASEDATKASADRIEQLEAALRSVSVEFDDTYSPASREGRLGRLARAALGERT